MAALSYGKRCLKAVLENDIKKKQTYCSYEGGGGGTLLFLEVNISGLHVYSRDSSATVWKKRLSPDAEAQRYCEAGLDKDGFEVKYISDYKGFGVFSVAEHAKGDFLLQYAGEKITKNEATERMKKSTENKFFFYCYKGQDLCIDAEGVSNSICHFVNDADKTANSDVCKFEFEDDDCDDIDDDPFDIRKISDVSSEEDYISDSCSDSLQSEIIQQLCFKTKNFKPADLGQREENTGEVFNEDDGQMDLEQREENTGEVFNEDDGQMDLEQREENTGEVFNEDDGQMDLEQREENTGEVFNEDDGQMDLEQREENTGEVFNEDDGQREENTGEVFNEDDGQMDLEQREENTGEVFNEDDGRFEDSALKSTRAKPKKERPGRITFYKHKETCSSQAQPVKTKTLRPLDLHYSEEFVLNILNKFRDGSIGNFIRESKIVQTIGYKHYLARRSESSKTTEVRREVMMEMRELSRLFFCFKSIAEEELSFEEMYERNHLSTLKEAFSTLCTGEEGEKYGLKMNLNSIFQRSIKILLGYYSETQLDSKVKELERFRKAYNFNLPDIVGKARYHTEKNSLKKARLPKSLPLEDEMRKLKQFLIQEIDDTVENFSLNRYTWLRSLVVARLTLYNARRGEEGSRLLLEEWYDAINSTWIPQEAVESVKDDAEKYLIGH
uniref:Uncharacterized protein n=1 Tax=Magallana gigas TaxID=29159 RepID=A0A8W8ML29_MAGGI